MPVAMTPVAVYGARQHNLKNVTCSIPRGQLVVVTGPSGSGKSSLAFGTVYAEALRRYAEVLPRATRRHLDHLSRPDVDDITGLCPVVAMEQTTVKRSKRATLGTFSEISDYLRRLFAYGATAHCPVGAHPIVKQSAAQIVERLLQEPAGTKLTVLAPLLRDAAPSLVASTLADLNAQGFVRVVVNGVTVMLSEVNTEVLPTRSSLDLVADRIVLRPGIETRLADSVELALREGDSTVLVDFMDGTPIREFSDKLVCRTHQSSLPDPAPQLFSFNHRAGACVGCNGLGARPRVDIELAIPNPQLSLRQGALAVFGAPGSVAYATLVHEFVKRTGLDPDVPWSELKPSEQAWDVLHELLDSDSDDASEGAGLTGQLSVAERGSFLQWVQCSVCSGRRLGPHAQHFTLSNLTFPQWASASLDALSELVRVEAKQPNSLHPLWLALEARIDGLRRLGLGYLTLDTPLLNLSSGELQRANLAQHTNGALTGVLYVLDEPTASLGEPDAQRVIAELKRLIDQGNSLLVVEHNPRVWREASHLIDMGPSAGALGGFVVATGSGQELASDPKSITGPYLAGTKTLERPRPRHSGSAPLLRFEGLCQGNLKNLSVAFPIGRVSVVTGPSGSGKTTLVMRALLPAMRMELRGVTRKDGRTTRVEGTPRRLLTLDQSPIGGSFRSTLVTYTGLLTHLRELFASLPESRTRGFKAARFSYNSKGGRCETCKGEGVVRLDPDYPSELGATCPECLGARFNRQTLAPRFRGLSIADVLQLTVDQAMVLFSNVPKLASVLRELTRLGLGYVVLGQPAPSLSGGEAQRIRLATELSKASSEPTLYLLDEPMVGLHPVDAQLVLDALFALCEAGHTVIIVEHDSQVVPLADWIVELGPGAGPSGGQLLYCGPAGAQSGAGP